MANLKVKNADGTDKYLKASGAGTDGDPHIPEHTISGTVAVTGTFYQATQPVRADVTACP